MKEKTKSVPCVGVIGLKTKVYALLTQQTCIKKAKGVQKSAQDVLTFQHYDKCLRDEQIIMGTMNQIRSINHQLYTLQINKKVLSPYEDKRFLLNNGIDSLAYGHYKIDSLLSETL